MTEPLALFDAEETLEAVRTGRHHAYPAYKPSGIEWLGDVPEHWDVKFLKHVASVQFSNVDKHTVEGEIPVRLCNYTDVYYNDRITAGLQFMEATATKQEIAKFRLEPGDVLVTKDSEDWSDIAVPALVADELTDVLCGYHLAQIRADPNCSVGSYLARAFASSGIMDQFHVAASGVTRYGLPKNALRKAVFPVPPLEEQQAIACFLDEQTEKIDDLISAKRDLLALSKEKRQAVITHAVTRGLDPTVKLKPSGVEWLGDVPEHWVPKKLGHLANLRGGSTPSKSNEDFWQGDIPWVSPKDMKSLVIRGSEDHVSESALAETNLGLLDPPAVLMVVRGMILAHSFPVGITTVPVTINQDMKALTPRDGISSEYLLDLLNGISKVVLGVVSESAHGTRVLRISQWKHIAVYLPDEQEQEAICDYINAAREKYDRMIAEVQTAIDRLHEYRTSLISAAVTGKIDVRGEGL